MENDFKQQDENGSRRDFRNHERKDRFWTGFVLILIGGALFLNRLGLNLPNWLFTWPMILVVVGIVSGIKHGFTNISWLIITGVGVFFLFDDWMDGLNLREFFWPVMIIAIGLVFILRPKRRWYFDRDRWRSEKDKWKYENTGWKGYQYNTGTTTESSSSEDFLSSFSLFGGVKKVVTSKNFRGGEIVCIMGGSEINLTQADISGPITIEVIQAFGGTKLIVPSHWEIRPEAVAIFAAVEDKRSPQMGAFDPNKVLIIKGTSVFGGIEIKSF